MSVEDKKAGEEDENFNINKIKQGSTKTPFLDVYGRDLTKLAQQKKIEPVIGREAEIDQIVQILNKKKKNNPILIGPSGSGKTTIIEGLALRIAEKKIDRWLFNKKIIELNLMSIVAGTKYRGEFEQRMEEIIKEAKGNQDIILFIDEIHNILGAGGASGSLDAANIIKPPLSRGEMHCIGATTMDEYKKSIENDSAMDRRFQKVMVSIPTNEQTKEILRQIKPHYESYHGVSYSNEVIDVCVDLADRYLTYKNFPDKAIDLLDETGSKVKLKNTSVSQSVRELEKALKEAEDSKFLAANTQDYEGAAKFRDIVNSIKNRIDDENNKWMETVRSQRIEVKKEDVAEIISAQTGIPLNKLTDSESIKLLEMEKILKEKIIGQDEAIEKIVNAIKRNRVGVGDPNKPASFVFLGNSGVGKTQLAKVLAEYLFDSEESFTRIDMSEFSEPHSISKLIGTSPGYVGYDEKGMLTEKLKNHPYCIILFDEIEKAHKDFFDILLQVLDAGRLTDSHGKVVNFKNAIIIMTSNIGTEKILTSGKQFGFSTQNEDKTEIHKRTEEMVFGELKKRFKPEFLNRIGDTVIFRPLDSETILKIVDIELKKVHERMQSKGYKLNIDLATKKFLAEKGFNQEYGARPLQRVIVEHIETPIANYILSNTKLKTGATLKIKFSDKNKNTEISSIISKN